MFLLLKVNLPEAQACCEPELVILGLKHGESHAVHFLLMVRLVVEISGYGIQDVVNRISHVVSGNLVDFIEDLALVSQHLFKVAKA